MALCTLSPCAADEVWQLNGWRNVAKAKFMDAWCRRRFDVILCPAIGVPAFRHGGSEKLTPACSWNFLWNLLHFPAGVLPTSLVRANECSYTCPKAQDDDFAKAARADMVTAAGMPVGVQLVALPYQDELCLGAMKATEAALKAFPQSGPVPCGAPETVLRTAVAAVVASAAAARR